MSSPSWSESPSGSPKRLGLTDLVVDQLQARLSDLGRLLPRPSRRASGTFGMMIPVTTRARKVSDLGRAFRGGPAIAIAITAAAWLSIAVAFATDDFRFAVVFLLLAATAPCVAFFSFLVERRWAAYVAFVLTLTAPLATVIYVARQPDGWLG